MRTTTSVWLVGAVLLLRADVVPAPTTSDARDIIIQTLDSGSGSVAGELQVRTEILFDDEGTVQLFEDGGRTVASGTVSVMTAVTANDPYRVSRLDVVDD